MYLAPIMLEQLIITILTYLNAGGYYKSAEEIKNAINVAQLDLYKRLRGNLAQYAPGRPSSSITPQETNVTADAISELYYVVDTPTQAATSYADILNGTFAGFPFSRTIDLVLSLEVSYTDSPAEFYPVNIVPDNQFLMMKNNPVIPPVQKRPLGRMVSSLLYECSPSNLPTTPPVAISSYKARVLTLPNQVDFYFDTPTPRDGPIPNIIIPPGSNIDWSIDKLDNMVYGTVANLGFNLSNGVLVQSGNAMNDKIL
jgi:hypothetical protein